MLCISVRLTFLFVLTSLDGVCGFGGNGARDLGSVGIDGSTVTIGGRGGYTIKTAHFHLQVNDVTGTSDRSDVTICDREWLKLTCDPNSK